ncbi:hypothetical protein MPSEU_001079500 [Mayamaea pseudoterrestris]|nr:hypothetical protein MPSEU_001079500 [Mayamaea pseudoterrestris]
MSAWGKGASAVVKEPPKPTSSLASAASSATSKGSSKTTTTAKPAAGGWKTAASSSKDRVAGRGLHSTAASGGRGVTNAGGRGAGHRSGNYASQPSSQKHAHFSKHQDEKQTRASHGPSSLAAAATPHAAASNHSGNSKKRPSMSGSKDKPKPAKLASTKTLDEIVLFLDDTNADTAVVRIPQSHFLACRMKYLEAPREVERKETKADKVGASNDNTAAASDENDVASSSQNNYYWTPHLYAHWTAKDRVELIQAEMQAMNDLQPLAVNNDTRWKPKRVKKKNANDISSSAETGDANVLSPEEEEQIGKAFAILNKLSWTTLDKLTKSFLQALGLTKDSDVKDLVLTKPVISKMMRLLVDKAMLEPHFCELYARFAERLGKAHKSFRRTLLALCQELFNEQDVVATSSGNGAAVAAAADTGNGGGNAASTSSAAALNDSTTSDAREKELDELLARKKSIGLMHFIGELYHVGLIKGDIMIGCLQKLLQPDDEERLDCFCKLMTTIGSRLHDDETEKDEAMQAVWRQVYVMAGIPVPTELAAGKEELTDADKERLKAPSVRVKFLLQDLIELKENNWVHRRKQEKAKSIKEIHKEVLQEEAAQRRMSQQSAVSLASNGSRKSLTMIRSQSTTSVEAIPDEDGFVNVAKPKKNASRRSSLEVVSTKAQPSGGSGPKTSLQLAAEGKTTGSKGKNGGKSEATSVNPKTLRTVSPTALSTESPSARTTKEHFDASECAKRGKSLFKEFFMSGDFNDAVLTVDEIVCFGEDGHVERGAAMIEAAVMMILEMKKDEVEKMLSVLERCIQEKKISSDSLVAGVQAPMESLRDIEIDAPLAASHMATILASWMRLDLMSLEMLKSCPDYFLTDGRPAEFACMVLAKRGGPVSYEETVVVEKLMSLDEQAAHSSISDWIASFAS